MRTAGSSTGCIATVYAIESGGIRLILPGETEPGEKRYPYNAAIDFKDGQRVHIARDGGTIIVEYPIAGGVTV